MFISILFSEELKIGISKSIPPYVFKETKSGLEMDILKEAFKVKDYEVVPVFLPLVRTFLQLKEAKIDGVINIKDGMVGQVFYSDEVIAFENVAICLKKKNYPDSISIDFLKDKNIIAFQEANTILGPEFNKMTKINRHYQEYADQTIQVNRLFLERNADFIILEKRIFQYLREKSEKQLGNVKNQPVKYYYLFQPTIYKFAFRDSTVCQDFNYGLKMIQDNGVYDDILRKWEKE